MDGGDIYNELSGLVNDSIITVLRSDLVEHHDYEAVT